MSEERPTSDAGRQDPAEEARSAEQDRATDRVRATDADAWATACEEDLVAEKARRRAKYGPPPGSAAEELRRLVDTVADKLSGLQSPLLGAVAGGAAQQVVSQVVRQAKAAVEPVIERNPDVFDHLASAGNELLAAYRSAVEAQERRWTNRDTAHREGRGQGDDPGPGERIDLD
ncbi:DUF5304 domain-containing protein [Streptomyces sp. NPDC001868]|uniref:DUF5304 domain-containing protein n=1 Tax=Streptomyces sp. NPDC001868 TaxID=3154401 RepID=UPI0033214C4A